MAPLDPTLRSVARPIAVTPALGRLRFGLRRDSRPISEVETSDLGPTKVEIVAYAEDCILSGDIALEAQRLTDLLDEQAELHLANVRVRGLHGEATTEVPAFVVHRDDLLLVHPSGPRGDRGRRRPTRQFPVRLETGPYRVRGYLHALPGSDPIASFARRRAMVPLTDAWIECETATPPYLQRVGTVIVNRAMVDAIAEAIDDDQELPDLPLPDDPGLVKDFSYELHVETDPEPSTGA